MAGMVTGGFGIQLVGHRRQIRMPAFEPHGAQTVEHREQRRHVVREPIGRGDMHAR